MTSTVENTWVPAPGAPTVAAPLRAVDVWRCEQDEGKVRITARVAVNGDDPNLRGHFPGLPVFPGIFVIEAVCQAMTLVGLGDDTALPCTLRSVRSVRFLAPLLDGDELTLEITASRQPGGCWDVKAEGTRRDGTTTAKIRAEFEPCEGT